MSLVPGYCELPLAAFPLLYGTARKQENTTALCKEAFAAGFRGIDAACQPKNYREDLVGDALVDAFTCGTLKREETWIQTKFTNIRGQDPRSVPYDPTKPLPEQVKESIQVSRRNLKVEIIDSLVLHNPEQDLQTTLSVWHAMEDAVRDGYVRHLGISNCYDLPFLMELYDAVSIKPAVVQNRFYRDEGWDIEHRQFCSAKNIAYQTFWTLTANPTVLKNPSFNKIAAKYELTSAQLLFKYALDTGCQPLSGTTTHQIEVANVMKLDFKLSAEEISTIDGTL